MESLPTSIQLRPFPPSRVTQPQLMTLTSTRLFPSFRITKTTLKLFSTYVSAVTSIITTQEDKDPPQLFLPLPENPITGTKPSKGPRKSSPRGTKKVLEAQLKENWLDSLCCPLPHAKPSTSDWVLGIDPDVSGALALLKPDYPPQVFDCPHLRVLVGKRVRKRLDAKSIAQLLQSFEAPIGTTAFLEQSTPFPQDGKQGWWSGGFGYGLWIGVLIASGFSVVPVPSSVWKNEFKLTGNRSCKDNSRELASTLFPSMVSLLKRKKDHGRAEALLIAAYGRGLKMDSDSPCITENATDSAAVQVPAVPPDSLLAVSQTF